MCYVVRGVHLVLGDTMYGWLVMNPRSLSMVDATDKKACEDVKAAGGLIMIAVLPLDRRVAVIRISFGVLLATLKKQCKS